MKEYKTDRIFIKEMSAAELTDEVMNWFDDVDLMKYYTNSGNKITRESLVESIKKGKENEDNFTYGVHDIETNRIIGTVKIGPINKKQKISDLVTLIGDKNFLGKGLAPEIIKLGNKIAFEEHDIRKLYGGMYMSNIPSIKAYTRGGWIIEGRLNGFYWNDGKNEDRLLVTCLNPKYFTEEEVNQIKKKESLFYNQ